jgi:hypothetical protein
MLEDLPTKKGRVSTLTSCLARNLWTPGSDHFYITDIFLSIAPNSIAMHICV